jgi:nitrogen fixation protein FixH
MKAKLMVYLFCAAYAINTYGQENMLNLQRTIPLKQKTKEQKIEIEVSGDVDQFDLKIMCDIEKGKVTIEVFDPAGRKQGKFTLGSEDYKAEPNEEGELTYADREQGKLEKSVKDPDNGIWIIRVTQQKAKGYLNIRSSQHYRSK